MPFNFKRYLRVAIKNLFLFISFPKREINGLRILTYHRVGNYEPKDVGSFVPLELFKEQMDYLNLEGYNVISLSLASFYLKFGLRIPPQSLVITFDDGYVDNFHHAYPILKRLRFPATIFLITSYIKKEKNLNLNGDVYLNHKQIKEMRRHNIEFGSHTLNHPRLSQLNAKKLWKEIYLSRLVLEHLLEEKIKFFCYPYGDFDHRVLKVVASAGYIASCSVKPGANFSRNDLFRLRRTEISYRDDIVVFRTKIAGRYDLAHFFYQLYARTRGELIWV